MYVVEACLYLLTLLYRVIFKYIFKFIFLKDSILQKYVNWIKIQLTGVENKHLYKMSLSVCQLLLLPPGA
jgi:hypothetical protein